MRIGSYFISVGRADRATPIFEDFTPRLSNGLGHRHPTVLQVRTITESLYMQAARFPDAYSGFDELVGIELDDLGMTRDIELYRTMLGKGTAEFLMNRYELSAKTLHNAYYGLQKFSGQDSDLCQTALMWLCLAMVACGDTQLPPVLLSHTLERRRQDSGPGDAFIITAEYCIGNIYRLNRMGMEEKGLEYLQKAFERHQRTFPLDSIWLQDIAISHLIAFRECGQTEEPGGSLSSSTSAVEWNSTSKGIAR